MYSVPNSAEQLHPAVENILRTGLIPTGNGKPVKASSHIPRDECELLYRQIRETKATSAIEVGMAFGISSLCICDALRRNASVGSPVQPRLIVMDPAQHDHAWQGLGLHQLQAAGFGEIVDFREETSQACLPKLVAENYRVQFAFIDGWHTFDHTLIDFFYIDQMLEDGGVVVFDDVGYQAINAVVRFVLGNRAYELIEALEFPRTNSLNRLKRHVKRWLRPLARTDRDPSSEHQQIFGHIEWAHSVALRKVSSDSRRWDHYHAF